jgi:hypothetical protein
MAGKVIVVLFIVLAALGAPCLVNVGVAAPIPTYFEDEWIGALCVQMAFTGSPQRVPVLIQLNFDKSTNGGITLQKADQLFNFLKNQIQFFVGSSVTQTCAFTPTQVNNQFHVNGLQAAQDLTRTYQQRGFVALIILDSFWSRVPDYLAQAPNALTLRSDVFLTSGPNDIVYTSSSETLQAFLP